MKKFWRIPDLSLQNPGASARGRIPIGPSRAACAYGAAPPTTGARPRAPPFSSAAAAAAAGHEPVRAPIYLSARLPQLVFAPFSYPVRQLLSVVLSAPQWGREGSSGGAVWDGLREGFLLWWGVYFFRGRGNFFHFLPQGTRRTFVCAYGIILVFALIAPYKIDFWMTLQNKWVILISYLTKVNKYMARKIKRCHSSN